MKVCAQKTTALAEPDVARRELALALGISLDTAHRLTHSGDIPYLRRGRLYRYNVAEVREA